MQTLLWNFYLYVSVARAYLVGSFKAALRQYYKDPNILPKAMFAYWAVCVASFVLLGSLMPHVAIVLYLVSLAALFPYFVLISKAMQWDRSKDYNENSRRCAERLRGRP